MSDLVSVAMMLAMAVAESMHVCTVISNCFHSLQQPQRDLEKHLRARSVSFGRWRQVSHRRMP